MKASQYEKGLNFLTGMFAGWALTFTVMAAARVRELKNQKNDE